MSYLKNQQFDFHILVTSAFRYSLGRMSTAPSNFSDFCREYWSVIPENTKSLIKKELSEAVKNEVFHHDPVIQYSSLGMECDRNVWINLLNFMEISNDK